MFSGRNKWVFEHGENFHWKVFRLVTATILFESLFYGASPWNSCWCDVLRWEITWRVIEVRHHFKLQNRETVNRWHTILDPSFCHIKAKMFSLLWKNSLHLKLRQIVSLSSRRHIYCANTELIHSTKETVKHSSLHQNGGFMPASLKLSGVCTISKTPKVLVYLPVLAIRACTLLVRDSQQKDVGKVQFVF